MASITNAVLSERQDQHHVQTMLAMARMEDQLIKMNGSVRDAQISDAEHGLRIECSEKRLVKMEKELKKAQDHAWKVALAVALLTGMGMAGANTVLGLVVP